MPAVTFQFENLHGEVLGASQFEITQRMELAAEKFQNAAEGLLKRPDDASCLQRIVSTAQAFGETVLPKLVPLHFQTNSQLSSIHQIPEGTRLTVTGDWTTHRLPWEAAAIDSSWLGVRFALKRVVSDGSDASASDIPSPVIATDDQRDLTVFRGHGPGLVGTVSECNLAEHWLRKIRRTAGLKGQVCSLVTSEPSRQRLLDALSNSSFVHYSGHGVIDPLTQQRALAPIDSPANQLVTSEDIRRLKRVPDYIYLNGCGLASHAWLPENSGDELPITLIRLGARWVVGPTVRFMTYRYFELLRAYYRWSDGLSWGPADAMRKARAHLVSTPMLQREFPLALYTVVYGPARSWSLVSTKPDSSSDTTFSTGSTFPMAYPIPCSSCKSAIQTKFGNYAITSTDPPLCRSCFLVVQAGQSVSGPSELSSEPNQESESSLRFRRKLADDALQFTKYYCPDRKIEIPCQTRRLVVQPVQLDPNRPYLKMEPELSYWTESIEVIGTQRLLRKNSLALLRIRFEDRSPADPLGRQDLERLFGQLDQADKQDASHRSDMHRFHIVVSPEGFTQEAWDFISSPGTAWRDDHRSILIHDSKTTRTGFAAVDTHAHSLESFFRPFNLDEQFTRIMDWLQVQLPLRESLSLRAIASQTGFAPETIENAMRIFARKNGLSLVESNQYGLCIEDSLVMKHKPSNEP